MSEFSRKGDPKDHCKKYELPMIGMGHNDIMLCKMFKTYLKGSASMWYKSLKPRSIGSYEQLKRKFLKYYSHLCRKAKYTESLVHCRQRANEELGDYLTRFKEEAEMVTNLDKVKEMGFLTTGLDPYKGKKLRSSLYDFPPKSLNDIYVRGENIRQKMEIIGDIRTPKGMTNQSELTSMKAQDQVLTTGMILHEIKGKPEFVQSAKIKVLNHKKNPDKYCDHHRDKGHNTDECYHLKKLIERMIKDGKLNQFVRNLRDRLGPKENQEEKVEAEEPEQRDKIRGEAKSHMPMTFSTEDYEDVIRPHEDPLIINPIIRQNKIWKGMLEPCNEAPLYTIGGHPIQFEGTIKLPVLLGKLPYTVEKPVKFYMVWIESPYNVIFGRPFLSTFKAVESVPHLKLKFPTEKGVGKMRGDQKTARIIILEDLEKDQEYEGSDETGKRKRAEAEHSGSREILNIELEKIGADLSSSIAEPAAETEEVELYAGHSGKTVRIGKNIGTDLKEKVIAVIQEYYDVFAWGLEDIPSLGPKIAKHCLNLHPEAKPVKQKKRTFAVKR
ncbi:uncharacterized protein LOC141695698 [Apium graveolens]|uniref:uncharacterized protein LOC141695698 n=1 Tax=Apium graveolens TaxID=4045 RepID=UPI003D7AF92D